MLFSSKIKTTLRSHWTTSKSVSYPLSALKTKRWKVSAIKKLERLKRNLAILTSQLNISKNSLNWVRSVKLEPSRVRHIESWQKPILKMETCKQLSSISHNFWWMRPTIKTRLIRQTLSWNLVFYTTKKEASENQ